MIFALATKQDWPIHHIDVKSAFLHGEVYEDVYNIYRTTTRLCGRRRRVVCLQVNQSIIWFETIT